MVERKKEVFTYEPKKEKSSKTGRVMKNQHQQFFLSVFFFLGTDDEVKH